MNLQTLFSDVDRVILIQFKTAQVFENTKNFHRYRKNLIAKPFGFCCLYCQQNFTGGGFEVINIDDTNLKKLTIFVSFSCKTCDDEINEMTEIKANEMKIVSFAGMRQIAKNGVKK